MAMNAIIMKDVHCSYVIYCNKIDVNENILSYANLCIVWLSIICAFTITKKTCIYGLKTPRVWVTHICIKKQNIIGSENVLPPDQYQAIIGTNAVLFFN